MASSRNKAGAVRLTDDGELVKDAPEEKGAIYCTACGAKNQPDSNFCRTCGESLQTQAGRPMRKSKDQRGMNLNRQPVGDNAAIAFIGMLRLLIVGVLVMIMALSLQFPSNFIVPVVLIVFGLAADKIFK